MLVSRLLRTLFAAGVCALSAETGVAAVGMSLPLRSEGLQIVTSERRAEDMDVRSREGFPLDQRRRGGGDFSPQWAELSIEQRQQMREQIRQHWQSQPPEERERMRSEWQQRSPEDRQRIREEMRERFERMSPEDREHFRNRLREFSPGDAGGMRRRN